jgi:hypothetical protein
MHTNRVAQRLKQRQAGGKGYTFARDPAGPQLLGYNVNMWNGSFIEVLHITLYMGIFFTLRRLGGD